MPTTDELAARLDRVENSQGVILDKLATITRILQGLVVVVVAWCLLSAQSAWIGGRRHADLVDRLEAAYQRIGG